MNIAIQKTPEKIMVPNTHQPLARLGKPMPETITDGITDKVLTFSIPDTQIDLEKLIEEIIEDYSCQKQ